MSTETALKKFVDSVSEVIQHQSKMIQELQVTVHNQGVIIDQLHQDVKKLKNVRPELFKQDEETTIH